MVLPDLLLKEDSTEMRRFVAERMASELITRMDRGEVVYPREFFAELGKENLLSSRFPLEKGGSRLGWEAEIVYEDEDMWIKGR